MVSIADRDDECIRHTLIIAKSRPSYPHLFHLMSALSAASADKRIKGVCHVVKNKFCHHQLQPFNQEPILVQNITAVII